MPLPKVSWAPLLVNDWASHLGAAFTEGATARAAIQTAAAIMVLRVFMVSHRPRVGTGPGPRAMRPKQGGSIGVIQIFRKSLKNLDFLRQQEGVRIFRSLFPPF